MPNWITVPHGSLYLGSCFDCMADLHNHDEVVDLVIGSPPYENVRTYGINFDLKGQDWVDWMVTVYRAALRICPKGLVAFVVGHGKGGCRAWSGAPAILAADLIRAGITLRNPPILYMRHGIPGSGGNDWLAAHYEWIICATKNPEMLGWSDNTACGHEPKYGAGGEVSHRTKDGTRINKFTSINNRDKNGDRKIYGGRKITTTSGYKDGDSVSVRKDYFPPEKANPGNVIDCGGIGGGKMGSDIAHENEAPFPLKIPEFFIKSFCPPDGIVYDPFCGSGSTCHAAILAGRRFIGSDIRKSQIELTQRRIEQAIAEKGLGLSV